MKRIICYVLGLLMVTFGIASTIVSSLGAPPWGALFSGLSITVGWTTGIWTIIVCVILLFVNAILEGARPDFPAVINILLQGVFTDFWLEVVLRNVEVVDFPARAGFFVLGFVVFVVGIALNLQARFAPNPIDRMMFSIEKRFGVGAGRARLVYDGVVFVLAWLLSGPIFWGTFILVLGSGPLIARLNVLFKKWFFPETAK